MVDIQMFSFWKYLGFGLDIDLLLDIMTQDHNTFKRFYLIRVARVRSLSLPNSRALQVCRQAAGATVRVTHTTGVSSNGVVAYVTLNVFVISVCF